MSTLERAFRRWAEHVPEPTDDELLEAEALANTLLENDADTHRKGE